MPLSNTLLKLFGPDVATKVANRHKGGANDRKGNDFETRYAVFLVAKYAHSKNATIVAQAIEPVDDLQIRLPASTGVEVKKIDYQCKDRQSLSWNEIASDFKMQNTLNHHLKLNPSRQIVVVTSHEVGASLTKSMPADIKTYSAVHVCCNATANRLLTASQEIRLAIQKICAFPDQQDKLETVFLALSGIWLDQPINTPISVSSIIEKARSSSMAYIRLDGEREIPDDICYIFDQIQGFSYRLQRGFFSWSYAPEFLEGHLAYNCDDRRFYSFLKLIRMHSPSSFCDLEPYLDTGNIS